MSEQNEKRPQIEIPLVDETSRKVAEFLAEKQAERSAAEQPEPETKLAPDPVLSGDNPDEMMLRSAMTDFNQVTLSDEEKNLFIKALLTDTPVRLDIAHFNGQAVFSFRSRTMYEQKRVLDVLHFDIGEKVLPDNDPAQFYTRLQQYMAAVMLERVNGKIFSDFALVPEADSHTNESLQKDALTLRDFFNRKLATMGHIRWVATLNALREFEAKCRKMSEECINENFWKPQG